MAYDQLLTIASRHKKLLALISEGKHSSRGLSRKLGVSEPTIYRNVEFLKRTGHKIRAVRVLRAWAYQLADSKEEEAA